MSGQSCPLSSFVGVHWGKIRAVQCSAVHCSAVQCSAVKCSKVQCTEVQCSALTTPPIPTIAIGHLNGGGSGDWLEHFYKSYKIELC